MRLTLEQLKAMSEGELRLLWNDAVFPFDTANGCNDCLTTHADLYDSCLACGDPTHANLIARMRELKPLDKSRLLLLHTHLEELYALRLFYDHLYPQPTPAELVQPQATASEHSTKEVSQ